LEINEKRKSSKRNDKKTNKQGGVKIDTFKRRKKNWQEESPHVNEENVSCRF